MHRLSRNTICLLLFNHQLSDDQKIIAMNTTLDYAPHILAIRDTLFGDFPLAHWAGVKAAGMPWDLFKEAKHFLDIGHEEKALVALQTVLSTPGLESRHYLQAWHVLSLHGTVPAFPVEIFGLVVEVAMPDGLDLLAVYADHTARYYNYSGSGIVWDMEDAEIGGKIDVILQQGQKIIQQIGPWQGERPAAPVAGKARLNILTSHGLYFGEAGQQVLFNDPLASPTMFAMLDMMETLIRRTKV